MFKIYADLTKLGIVIFVLLSGVAGYALSFSVENSFSWMHFLKLSAGLYFLSSGSLALNQVQEFELDKKMQRTEKRPIASGKVKPVAAGILAVTYIFVGINLLLECSWLAAILGALTVVCYNGLYVYWWKPRWVFAAIPGAFPGALPVTIGYAANSDYIFSRDSVYLFLILFFWQMPHFWVLAIRYKEDYLKANIPILPAVIGMERTLYHMGLWTILYVGTALMSPVFVHTNWIYLLLIIPIAVKLLQEFYHFFKSQGKERWLAFFMWVNISVLIFLYVPVADKWLFLFVK